MEIAAVLKSSPLFAFLAGLGFTAAGGLFAEPWFERFHASDRPAASTRIPAGSHEPLGKADTDPSSKLGAYLTTNIGDLALPNASLQADHFVESLGVTPNRRRVLLRRAFAACVLARQVTDTDVATILKQLSDDDRLVFIEVWLDSSWVPALEANQARFRKVLGEAGISVDKVLEEKLQRLVLQIAARKNAPLPALLSLASAVQKGGGLKELSAILAVNPNVITEAVRDGMLKSDDLASLAVQAKLSPALLRKILAEGLPEKSAEVAASYFAQAMNASPLLARDFSAEFSAAELPRSSRDDVVYKLMQLTANEAVDWLDTIPAEERRSTLERAFRESHGPDDPAVSNYLKLRAGSPDVEPRYLEYTMRLLQNAALSDLEEYCRALPDPLRAKATQRVYDYKLRQASSGGVEEMRELIEKAPADLKDRLESMVAPNLSSQDYATAAAYLESIPDPERQKQLWIAFLSTSELRVSAEQRVTAIDSLLAKGLSDDDAVKVIATLVADDFSGHPVGTYRPNDAVPECCEFLDRLDSDSIKERVVGPFVKTWAAFNPVGASEWVAAMPSGKVRDQAAYALVLSTQDDPEIAFTNTASISDQKLREGAARQLLQTWGSIDRKFITDLLLRSPLSSDEKDTLRHAMDSTNEK